MSGSSKDGTVRGSDGGMAYMGAGVLAAAGAVIAAVAIDDIFARAMLTGVLALVALILVRAASKREVAPLTAEPEALVPSMPAPRPEPLAPEPEPEPNLDADAAEFEPLRRFIEEGPVNLALTDGEGAIQEYSGAFASLAGAERALVGANFGALFERKDGQGLFDAIAIAATGAPSQAVARLADGAMATCAIQLARLQDDPVVIAASIQDVTQEKKLEAQFAQSQKMLAVGQLAGGVAHDFNNLLTAIIGHADLLMLKHSPRDDSFADINQIKQNANRAANLVRQLLAFSRQQTLQPRVLDVGDTLADLGNLLRRLLGAGVTLKLRHGRDVSVVKVDQVQLEQVVINLAVNARDAMDGRGALDISTSMAAVGDTTGTPLEPMPAGDYVKIDVTDKGTGIAPEHVDRIFEPFFTTKPLGEGTGLGLATVYGIVKQTGGFIFVESEVGVGTTFSVYLRPHAEEEAPREAAAADKARDLTGVGTIMLVEDEDPVRLFGARALRGKGYRVIEASSGDAALKLFEEGEADDVDLLVTDIVMPELDGPSLIAAARKFQPALPVVCVSGYAESAFREKLSGIDDVHFLPKPFTLNQLAGKVKDVIQ